MPSRTHAAANEGTGFICAFSARLTDLTVASFD
jgi:hypothetical protein